MDPITRALHMRVQDEGASPSVTPLYHCSAFDAGSPYFYTRKSNPSIVEFEQVVADLEAARFGIAVPSGMAAIQMCLNLLHPGEVLVTNRFVYGCSHRLFQREAARLNLRLLTVDLSDPRQIESLPADTRMVIFETPTNPFLKSVRIRVVAESVKGRNPGALVVVDNTWATPLYQHPLEHGADISLHSGTKYFSGHSDAMGGILIADRDDLAEELRATRFYSGAVLAPHTAWLMRRSLQTLGVRLQQQGRSTLELLDFLRTLPQISRVYYPDVDGEQLCGYGGIVFVELRKDLAEKYSALVENLTLFGTGTGMACVTSMIAQPYTGSHASMTPEEKREMGLRRNLVRLCIGLENVEDLRQDLLQAFGRLEGERAPVSG